MGKVTVDENDMSVTIHCAENGTSRLYRIDERGEWYEACGRDGEDRKTPMLSVMPTLSIYFEDERRALREAHETAGAPKNGSRQCRRTEPLGQFFYMERFGDNALKGAEHTSGYRCRLGDYCLRGAKEVFFHVEKAGVIGDMESGVVIGETPGCIRGVEGSEKMSKYMKDVFIIMPAKGDKPRIELPAVHLPERVMDPILRKASADSQGAGKKGVEALAWWLKALFQEDAPNWLDIHLPKELR